MRHTRCCLRAPPCEPEALGSRDPRARLGRREGQPRGWHGGRLRGGRWSLLEGPWVQGGQHDPGEGMTCRGWDKAGQRVGM